MSRAFRLKSSESVPDGIARIGQGRIDHALDELRGETDSTPVEAVHEARKDMKKLRALARLTGGDGRPFQDVGRELAGRRDADVMLETLASLDAELPQLRQALEAHRLRTAGGGHGEAIALLEDAPLPTGNGPDIRPTYRRGRKAFRTARKEPSTENLHEWRKRVKDLWYQLLILQGAWKPVMKAMADEAHELSDRLGDDHDLATLLEWSRQHAPAEELEPLVERRRAELQAEAFAYGAKLYADKPKEFASRIERWWELSPAARPIS